MVRRLFTIASMFSLILCLASAGLWRDWHHTAIVLTCPNHDLWSIELSTRTVIVAWVHDWPGRQPIRLCGPNYPDSQGPFWKSPGFIPSDEEWMGIRFNSAPGQYALREDGSGYVSDADGPLPVIVMHYGQHVITRPTTYSGMLLTRYISIPAYLLAMVFAALPLFWTARRLTSFIRRRHHQSNASCPKCGYDLRASKDRCPECGRAIVANASAIP
jgi:hypothetical protein